MTLLRRNFAQFRGLLLFGLLCLLALCACAGDPARGPAATAPSSSGLELPALSELPRQVSTIGLTISASDFEPGLPHSGATLKSGGLRLSSTGASGLGGVSYAVYGFALGGYTGAQTLYLLQQDAQFKAGGGLQDLYVGLSNYSEGRWEWRQASAQALPGVFQLADITNYEADNDNAYVVVLLRGNHQLQLDALSFQRYDELEPNDAAEPAVLSLPAGDYGGLRGSIGSSEADPGYDGDNVDYWQLQPGTGDSVGADIYFDTAAASLELALVDAESSPQVTQSNAFQGHIHLQWPLFTGDGSPVEWPLYLRVTALSGAADYYLRGHQGDAPRSLIVPDQVTTLTAVPVHLDGSQSTDADGTIVAYYWDMDDFAQLEPITTPEVDWTFNSLGAWHGVRLRVTDDEGFTAQCRRVIGKGIPAYTEWEDNDDYDEAQFLSAPRGRIYGNLGQFGGSGIGFDGDGQDYTSLLLPAGKTLMVLMSNAEGGALPETSVCEIYSDLDFAQTDSQGLMEWPPAPLAEDRTVYLSTSSDASMDYYLDWSVGIPPTVTLQAAPSSFKAPYATTLIATASDPGGLELHYTWDLNNDGIFEADSGTISAINASVPGVGGFVFWVQVTNSDGLYARAFAVAVGTP